MLGWAQEKIKLEENKMEVKEGTGNIESKEEGSSKNGPYWKYTINGNIYVVTRLFAFVSVFPLILQQ